MSQHIITLLTDFGSRDAFVGVMKGVMLDVNPSVAFVDLSHEVPPQDILAGALILRSAASFFPPGTIHLAVVDPGVGSSRRALLVETPRAFFVGPDNGLLSLAAPADAVTRLIYLTNEQYFLTLRSQTFHGRDVFAPVAAHLSRGVPPERFGDTISNMERLALPSVERRASGLTGNVIYIDHFGNIITNITEADVRLFPTDTLLVSINSMQIRGMQSSYAAVEVGAPVAIINSWGLMEIAVRNGSAAQHLAIHLGHPVHLSSL
ncbi:MAG: S-adenosyl-l-methionine hydroxide adenosyltransferase family protein [Candidatus Binatia bacterium]